MNLHGRVGVSCWFRIYNFTFDTDFLRPLHPRRMAFTDKVALHYIRNEIPNELLIRLRVLQCFRGTARDSRIRERLARLILVHRNELSISTQAAPSRPDLEVVAWFAPSYTL